MSDDSPLDPSTGLLHRAAFLAEVRKGQEESDNQPRRGCLLILRFPVLHRLPGAESATQALLDLLGIVETRLRSRDTIGRIGDHSLCILLRQCRESDALLIADQYVALLRDRVFDVEGQSIPMDLHYRIVPLDWRGRRKRQGLSKIIRAPDDASQVVSALNTLANPEASGESKVVRLSRPHEERQRSSSTPELSGKSEDAASPHGTSSPDDFTSAAGSSTPAGPDGYTTAAGSRIPAGPDISASTPIARGHDATVAHHLYRLKPGMLLRHRPMLCCYRIRPVGISSATTPVNESALFDAVFHALALHPGKTRPLIESQLVVPVDARQLDNDTALWLKDECSRRSVVPSDICLSLRIESISRDLRATLPALRRLNRHGIRLMLENVSSAAQFSALQKLASFDYLMISARMLQGSLARIRSRHELEALIEMAGRQHRETCCDGIDTPALMAHAQELSIDIGFGRVCGRSEAFPDWQGS